MEQEAPQANSKEPQERDEEYFIVSLVETIPHPPDRQVHENDIRYRVYELSAVYAQTTRLAAAQTHKKRGGDSYTASRHNPPRTSWRKNQLWDQGRHVGTETILYGGRRIPPSVELFLAVADTGESPDCLAERVKNPMYSRGHVRFSAIVPSGRRREDCVRIYGRS